MTWHMMLLGRAASAAMTVGQAGEGRGRREQRIEARIGEQVERQRQAAAAVPARALRRRDRADLARDQPQAPAVEGLAERQRAPAGRRTS